MGSVISGATDFINVPFQAVADKQSSDQQFIREQQQADAAIEGARAKGNYEAGKARVLSSMAAGKQKVAYAASGVDTSSGTAADVRADTQALGELDAQTLAINAAREVYGYQTAKKQSLDEWQTRKGNNERKAMTASIGSLAKFAAGAASLGVGG